MQHTCCLSRWLSHLCKLLSLQLKIIPPAGCEDGAVTVWDLRTRQPIRTLQKGGKGPVTGLLVMDRPAFLAAGQGGRGEGCNDAAHNSASRKGPQRPQPLAPFSKYYEVAGGLKPWEGVPVVIDGSTPYRYCTSPTEVWLDSLSHLTATGAHLTATGVCHVRYCFKQSIPHICVHCQSGRAVQCEDGPAACKVRLCIANSPVQWLQLCCQHLGARHCLFSAPESHICCSCRLRSS